MADAHFKLSSFVLLTIVVDFRFGYIDEHLADGRRTIFPCFVSIASTHRENQLPGGNRKGEIIDIDVDHLVRRNTFHPNESTSPADIDDNPVWYDM